PGRRFAPAGTPVRGRSANLHVFALAPVVAGHSVAVAGPLGLPADDAAPAAARRLAVRPGAVRLGGVLGLHQCPRLRLGISAYGRGADPDLCRGPCTLSTAHLLAVGQTRRPFSGSPA